jgi:chlorosome envelope protein F
MANSNGVFSDLFQAVGAPIQNAADTVENGVNSAVSVAQSCTNLCTNVVTGTATAGLQFVQSILTGITSAIAPKQ